MPGPRARSNFISSIKGLIEPLSINGRRFNRRMRYPGNAESPMPLRLRSIASPQRMETEKALSRVSRIPILLRGATGTPCRVNHFVVWRHSIPIHLRRRVSGHATIPHDKAIHLASSQVRVERWSSIVQSIGRRQRFAAKCKIYRRLYCIHYRKFTCQGMPTIAKLRRVLRYSYFSF